MTFVPLSALQWLTASKTLRSLRSLVPVLVAALLALVIVALAASPAAAEGDPQHPWAAWQLQWENDAFAAFSGSDEHYTNGLRFSWVRNQARSALPGWVAGFGERWCGKTSKLRLCGPQPDLEQTDFGHSFVHTFYTPEELSIEELIVDDRPYAGYFHFGTQIFLRHDTKGPNDPGRNSPIQNVFELQLGFVGPEAQGEWIQSKAHEILDDEPPLGWDNQLDFEPVVQLVYRWRRKFGTDHADVVPHWGAALGNVGIFAEAGFHARFGWNIADFPNLNIAPAVSPASTDDAWFAKREFHVFVGATGRGVAHNIFLDGNTFEDSHSVDKENWVYDLQAGFVARYKKCRLSYTFTRRSREYSPTFDNDGGRHDYGTVAFSYLTNWRPSR